MVNAMNKDRVYTSSRWDENKRTGHRTSTIAKISSLLSKNSLLRLQWHGQEKREVRARIKQSRLILHISFFSAVGKSLFLH